MLPDSSSKTLQKEAKSPELPKEFLPAASGAASASTWATKCPGSWVASGEFHHFLLVHENIKLSRMEHISLINPSVVE